MWGEIFMVVFFYVEHKKYNHKIVEETRSFGIGQVPTFHLA